MWRQAGRRSDVRPGLKAACATLPALAPTGNDLGNEAPAQLAAYDDLIAQVTALPTRIFDARLQVNSRLED